MLVGLQEEIDKHPELVGASKEIIIKTLNKEGSAEVKTWVINPSPVMRTINDVYTKYISDASLTRLIDFLDQSENKALKLRFDKATHFNLSNDVVRTLMTRLHAAGIITDDEYNVLKRAGEVRLSRAEELFGRKITIEDFY